MGYVGPTPGVHSWPTLRLGLDSTSPTRTGWPTAFTAPRISAYTKGYSRGSRPTASSGQITTSGAGRRPALTSAASLSVSAAWFWVTSLSFSNCGRFLACGMSPWIAATGTVGAPPAGSTGSRPPASTSPAVTTAATPAPAKPRDRQSREPSHVKAARASMAPVSATRKVSSGTPPTATQRTSGATDWLMASRPQGKAKGHRSRSASAATHQAATAAGQNGRSSSSRWPTQSRAKMTASDPASAAHAYQATLISQDRSGTNKARPNTSPQPNDPRRLRPVSATTSSAGPAATGLTSSGGNEAKTASPPATLSSSAHRVRNPANAPARPVLAPPEISRASPACAEITLESLTARD